MFDLPGDIVHFNESRMNEKVNDCQLRLEHFIAYQII